MMSHHDQCMMSHHALIIQLHNWMIWREAQLRASAYEECLPAVEPSPVFLDRRCRPLFRRLRLKPSSSDVTILHLFL